jgi:hypothetical protein
MITVDLAVTVAASVAQLAATLNIVAGGLAIMVALMRLLVVLQNRHRRRHKP